MPEPKEALVLLPGMLCDARLFAPQIETFGDQYNISVGDIGGASTIADLAGTVLENVEEPKFNLLGLSMGAIVAMEIVRLAPQRVLRLALLDTNHLAEMTERKAMRMTQIEKVRSGLMRQVVIHEMKPNYLAEANRDNEALLDLLIDMAMDSGDETFVNQSIALRDRPDQSETLKKYKGPVLVLHGAEDDLCPPQRHREMAELSPNAKLVSIKNAGHISTLENSAEVNNAIGNWLTVPCSNNISH